VKSAVRVGLFVIQAPAEDLQTCAKDCILQTCTKDCIFKNK